MFWVTSLSREVWAREEDSGCLSHACCPGPWCEVLLPHVKLLTAGSAKKRHWMGAKKTHQDPACWELKVCPWRAAGPWACPRDPEPLSLEAGLTQEPFLTQALGKGTCQWWVHQALHWDGLRLLVSFGKISLIPRKCLMLEYLEEVNSGVSSVPPGEGWSSLGWTSLPPALHLSHWSSVIFPTPILSPWLFPLTLGFLHFSGCPICLPPAASRFLASGPIPISPLSWPQTGLQFGLEEFQFLGFFSFKFWWGNKHAQMQNWVISCKLVRLENSCKDDTRICNNHTHLEGHRDVILMWVLSARLDVQVLIIVLPPPGDSWGHLTTLSSGGSSWEWGEAVVPLQWCVGQGVISLFFLGGLYLFQPLCLMYCFPRTLLTLPSGHWTKRGSKHWFLLCLSVPLLEMLIKCLWVFPPLTLPGIKNGWTSRSPCDLGISLCGSLVFIFSVKETETSICRPLTSSQPQSTKGFPTIKLGFWVSYLDS